jgi:predicted metal-dependent peptidase
MSVMYKLKPMEKAQGKIAAKHVFFAALTLSTPFIARSDLPTAATDMRKVYYNEDFIARLDGDEVMFVVIHEIMHILLKHGLRLKHRDRWLWNIACDHVINLKLVALGFKLIDHPEWKDFGPLGLKLFCDKQYTDMHEEHVYELLLQEENDKPKPEAGRAQGSVNAKGSGGSSFSDDILEVPEDPSERKVIEEKIDRDVARAVTIAQARGQLPAGFEHLIKEFFEAQVSWEVVLQRFMSKFVRTESSWSRRNRRFHNVYLPGRKGTKLAEITIIGDSSGSMFNKTIFDRVGSEINYMIKRLKPDLVRVVWADDAECSNEEEFRRGDDVVLHPKGGGGTDMRRPLAHIEQYNPSFAILITDGYTPWPSQPTPYPLIVCCTTDASAPDWAMVVRIQIDA